MTAPAGRGLIVSAPSSGAGKTTVTLGLLRALVRRGLPARGAKSGPDYIDPRFHEAATGAPCPNLDAWAMAPERVRALAAGPGLLVVEGAMGLFDGAPPDGRGATAELARILRLPVVLVVDAARMAQSVAPLVTGFARHDPAVEVAGVILNRVGSARHERILRAALLGTPVLGALPRAAGLAHPSRHLGLVGARERADLDALLDAAAEAVADVVDLDALAALARPLPDAPARAAPAPPAQRIAVARDEAFAFLYPHVLAEWRAAGAAVTPFSPLADEPPPPDADLVILPGGYPELHAGRLAAARRFRKGMRRAALAADIHGECGGYMALGEGLIDAEGRRHAMLGLLPLETSFAERRLTLGYRDASILSGPFEGDVRAHEFRYATVLREGTGPGRENRHRYAYARDAESIDIGFAGLVQGRVRGSFLHLVERVPSGPGEV